MRPCDLAAAVLGLIPPRGSLLHVILTLFCPDTEKSFEDGSGELLNVAYDIIWCWSGVWRPPPAVC